jgi:cobalt-precorrin 5A hydrolase
MTGVVALGIGLSSKATVDEVRALAQEVLDRAGVGLDVVTWVATRSRFVDDPRVRLGPDVCSIDDTTLLERYPKPTGPSPARVAEGCALHAAGPEATLLVGITRSAHATAALAAAR